MNLKENPADKITIEMQKEIKEYNLYTFILEFNGGTYVKQIWGKNLKKAYKKWNKLISGKSYQQYFTSKEQNFLMNEFQNFENIIELDNIINVYYHGFSYKKYFNHFHIILTDRVV